MVYPHGSLSEVRKGLAGGRKPPTPSRTDRTRDTSGTAGMGCRPAANAVQVCFAKTKPSVKCLSLRQQAFERASF